MNYLVQAARLLLDPPEAAAELRDAGPLWRSLALAVVVSLLYQATLAGLVGDAFAIARMGGLDGGAAAIMWAGARRVVPAALGHTLAIAGVLVPVFLLLLGASERSLGAVATLRAHYRGTSAAALTAYAVALALWLPAAWHFGNPDSPQAVATWSVLPLLVVALLVASAASTIAGVGHLRAGAASAAAAGLVAALPFVGRAAGALAALISAFAAATVLRSALVARARAARDRTALDRARDAVAHDVGDTGAHLKLGLAYARTGELERAAEHFARARSLDPSDPNAAFQHGRVLRLLSDHAGAISALDAALRLDEHFAHGDVWREAGATYLAAGQYRDARTALEQFLALRRSDAEGLYLLGVTLAALGETDDARRRMLDVVELFRSEVSGIHGDDPHWLREAEAFLKGEHERG